MVAIIDYGIGNIGSIENMLKRAGAKDIIFAPDAEALQKASHILLPGVGSFDAGMDMLNNSGMREELDHQVLEQKKPILGICLGMQMLGKGSEEGKMEGLGYIDFKCRKFSFEKEEGIKVPHMGWDYVEINNKKDALIQECFEPAKFYFVHSYYAVCKDEQNVLMTCDYGFEFTAAVVKNNIYGVQFHPEKSHKHGMKLLENFVRI